MLEGRGRGGPGGWEGRRPDDQDTGRSRPHQLHGQGQENGSHSKGKEKPEVALGKAVTACFAFHCVSRSLGHTVDPEARGTVEAQSVSPRGQRWWPVLEGGGRWKREGRAGWGMFWRGR